MAGGGMNLVGLGLRNPRRRPIRTCLSILGVGLAVGSALALIALSRSIKDSTREGMDELGDDLVVMQKGASDVFGGFIPEQMVERVAAVQGGGRGSGATQACLGRGCRCERALGRDQPNATLPCSVKPRRPRSAGSSATSLR